MPEWTKVSHTSFSVRDAESSAVWSQRVLGLEEINRVEGDGWHGILLIHPARGRRCSSTSSMRLTGASRSTHERRASIMSGSR